MKIAARTIATRLFAAAPSKLTGKNDAEPGDPRRRRLADVKVVRHAREPGSERRIL